LAPLPDDLFLKPEYSARTASTYIEDETQPVEGVAERPDVYGVAAYLATQHRSDWIIDIGCGRAERIKPYADDFFVAGLDGGADIEACRTDLPFDAWRDVDLSKPDRLPLTDDQLDGATVVCSNLLERLADPRPLLAELSRIRRLAATIVLSTPDRDRTHGPDHLGPPADPARLREWNRAEFAQLLDAAGLAPAFLGYTMEDDLHWRRNTLLAIVEGGRTPQLEAAPDDFRVLAVVTGYNEKDILPFTLRRLLADGIEVVYVDNWSTDGSFEAVEAEFGDSVRRHRFPAVDTLTFDWADILGHVEEVGRAGGADWVVHHDADEIREGPWPGLSLRDSLWNVQRRGFNAVNHHVLDFRPAEGEPDPAEGQDPTEAMRWFEHFTHPANVVQIKAWKNVGQPVYLAQTGGHEARFPERRIFPYLFLLRHYSLRSPAHARRKIFVERASRWNPQERAQGWHAHYDDATEADTFLWPTSELLRWEPADFALDLLAERLTGVGVLRGDEEVKARRVTNPPTAARVAWKRLRLVYADTYTAAVTAIRRADASDRAAAAANRRAETATKRTEAALAQSGAAKTRAELAKTQYLTAKERAALARKQAAAAKKRADSATRQADAALKQIREMRKSRRWRLGGALEKVPAAARRAVKAGRGG
jgi:SAM-dependent methyltransferase